MNHGLVQFFYIMKELFHLEILYAKTMLLRKKLGHYFILARGKSKILVSQLKNIGQTLINLMKKFGGKKHIEVKFVKTKTKKMM